MKSCTERARTAKYEIGLCKRKRCSSERLRAAQGPRRNPKRRAVLRYPYRFVFLCVRRVFRAHSSFFFSASGRGARGSTEKKKHMDTDEDLYLERSRAELLRRTLGCDGDAGFTYIAKALSMQRRNHYVRSMNIASFFPPFPSSCFSSLGWKRRLQLSLTTLPSLS